MDVTAFSLVWWIVAAVCFSQLLTVNLVLSAQWRRNRYALIEKFPPHEYPNLYAQEENIERQRVRIRNMFDTGVFIMGLGLLFNLVVGQVDVGSVTTLMLILAPIQMLPMFVSFIWCRKNRGAMSKQFPSSVRQTSLIPRRLSDFISLSKLVWVGIAYFSSVAFAIWIGVTELWGDASYKALLHVSLSTIVVLALGVMVKNTIDGKRFDNFQHQQDRLESMQLKINELTGFIGAYSLFIIGIMLIKTLDLGNAFIVILTSICIQCILLTTARQYIPKRAEVYRD